MPGVVLIVIVINEWVANCLINIHHYVLQSLWKPARKMLDIATRWRRRQYLSIFKTSGTTRKFRSGWNISQNPSHPRIFNNH